MLAVAWQFDVQNGSDEAFEKLHGADGAWTALSRRSRSFLGSSFLKDLATPGRYLLLEYWSEMMVYEKHLADFSDHANELKAQRAVMVKETTALGIFDALDVPDRDGPTWSVRDGR
ncbi:MAG: hypothetical protein ABIT71_25890 [Vicinamibacteraceae bacterium]